MRAQRSIERNFAAKRLPADREAGTRGHPARTARACRTAALRWVALAPAFAAWMIASGCDGCHHSKPFTPYTLDEPDAPPPSEAPHVPQPSASPAAFASIAASPPPGDGTRWPLAPDRVVPAPAGRRFTLGLVLDGDGDGKADLMGWASAPDGLRGELWFASGQDPTAGVTVVALPGELAPPGCSAEPSLTQVGPHIVVFDFGLRCSASGPRASRFIAVVRLAASTDRQRRATPDLVLELRANLPHPGETIAIDVDGRDRDGDGHDDVTVNVTLSGALHPFREARPSLGAPLVFLDRPAGLSREPEEPLAALSAIARSLLADARSKAKAPNASPAARQLRRLFAIVCDEGGAAEVTTAAGPIRCGAADIVEDAAYAEALAAFTHSHPARAIAAMAQATQPFKSPARQKEIAKLLAKTAPVVKLAAIRKVAAVPNGGQPPPGGLGPVSFEPNDDLFVRTEGGVVRVDSTTFAESEADVPVWPERLPVAPAAGTDPAAPPASGFWLAGIEQTCETPVLAAWLQGPPAADGEPQRLRVPLPIATRTPCTPIAAVPWVPLGASAAETTIAAGTEVVSIGPGASPTVSATTLPLGGGGAIRGTARSPDGATVALALEQGVLVVSATAARRWIDPSLQGAWGCTPSNGGKRLACVNRGEVILLQAQ